MTVVVDASVAVKWFVPEAHTTESLRLLSGEWQLLAPDLLFAEVGNAVWTRVLRGEMTSDEAEKAVEGLTELPLHVLASWPLILAALPVAFEYRCAVYDALYVALAVDEEAPLVTADRKLYAAITAGPLAEHVMWVGDLV